MSKAICPKCGKNTATVRRLPTYHYLESGLDNVWLHGGVTETRCRACGEKFVRIWKEPQLLQVIASGILMEPKPLTGPELRFIRRSCALSQGELASLLQCPRRATIADREARKNPGLSFPEEIGVRVILLKSFQKYLAKPGNSFLEPTQFEEIWHFAGTFDHFAKKVAAQHRIQAAVQQELWTLKPERAAA